MTISTDKLKPGMEVTKAVVNLNQAVLLSPGMRVTAEHLRTLKMWGIDFIEVVGEDPPPTPGKAVSPELLRAAEARVNHRWKHVPVTNPAVALVREEAIKREVAQLAVASCAPANSAL